MPPTTLHDSTLSDAAPPAAFAARRRPPQDLLPVPKAETIWALAKREFGVKSVNRMPLRARMLDVLEHLHRGHLLALMGAGVPVVWLDGQHDIVLLAGMLFCYGYVEIAGRHRDNPHIVYFRLSDAGRRKLEEGRAWWHSLSLWQRAVVRILG